MQLFLIKRDVVFTKGYEAIRLYGFGDLSSLFSVYLISSTTWRLPGYIKGCKSFCFGNPLLHDLVDFSKVSSRKRNQMGDSGWIGDCLCYWSIPVVFATRDSNFKPYAHPNHFGTMINLMAPCIVYADIKNKDKWYRILSVIVLASAIVCLVMTRSRGALIALSASVIIGIIIAVFETRNFI